MVSGDGGRGVAIGCFGYGGLRDSVHRNERRAQPCQTLEWTALEGQGGFGDRPELEPRAPIRAAVPILDKP